MYGSSNGSLYSGIIAEADNYSNVNVMIAATIFSRMGFSCFATRSSPSTTKPTSLIWTVHELFPERYIL